MSRIPSGPSMTSRAVMTYLIAIFALCLWIGSSTADAQIEDPSIYPGVWYRIGFDTSGNKIAGDGDGYSGQWYYYPTSNIYRMWFYNDPYDPDRKGFLKYEAYIKPVDPSQTSYLKIRFNWTTPEWSALGRSGPPLPGDIPTSTEESAYMSGSTMHLVDNLSNFESIEPVRSYTVYGYNPEWISIDVIGRNAHVYRGAWHECREKSVSDPTNGGTEIQVCCRWSTGGCYTIFGGSCSDGYETLGSGQTCDDCIAGGAPTLDFGDAPDPDYPTLLASDGARHTVYSNVLLGKTIDAEADALSNETATGDGDDGVTFTSALQPGYTASISVFASTQGYLNAWIDFDGDGSFAGADEQIFADTLLSSGSNALTFEVPQDALPGATFARFRFNTRGLLSYDGLASDGEVEDYAVEISASYEPYQTSGVTALKWNQPPSAIDAANPYLFETTTVLSALDLYEIAADDFAIDDAQPITGIHWWGSFNGWTESFLPSVMPLAFHIGVWTDVPNEQPDDAKTFGHPGTLVWETYCTQWAWALAGYQETAKGETLGETCFQFSCLLSQNQWLQLATDSSDKEIEAAYYWISISAIYDPDDSLTGYIWGWITRPHAEGETATVIRGITPGPWPPSQGDEWLSGLQITESDGTPWDMAFQLTTYGGLEVTEKTETEKAEAQSSTKWRHLAQTASDWLDRMP